MLKEEYEKLAGIKVNESTYEVINAMYMSDNNMDKETFVKYFKKMNLLNYAEGRAEYTKKLRQEKEKQTDRAMQAERENVKLRKILDGEREARGMLSSKFKEDYEKLAVQYLLNDEQYDRVMKVLEDVEGYEIPATPDPLSSNTMLDLMGKSLQRPIIYDKSEKPDDMDLNTVIGYHNAFGFVIADSKGKDKLNTHVG